MSAPDFWDADNQAALRTLGEDAVADEYDELVDTDLTDTAGGISVLGYVLGCALPQGTSVTSGSDTFDGNFGLAPDWMTRGLTTAEQRWVTACALQHLNGLGEEVPLMLDGSHSALDPREGEDTSAFTVKDATMFGNVFVSSPVAYACIEADINLGCLLDLPVLEAALEDRICGSSSTCGVTVLGLCATNCTTTGSGDPSCWVLPVLGPFYPEAIRSTVEDTDAVTLYPGCGI